MITEALIYISSKINSVCFTTGNSPIVITKIKSFGDESLEKKTGEHDGVSGQRALRDVH